MLWLYVVLAALPVLALVGRPREGGVLIWTIAVTWTVITYAVRGVDDEDIAVFAFLVMPVLTVGIATVVATSLAQEPRRWFDAGFFALACWWVGFMILVFGPWQVPHGIWDDAMFVAFPTVYGASGAAFGATRRRS